MKPIISMKLIACAFYKLLLMIFITPVLFYKFCISPFIHHSCRYYPSCSEYCIQSIKKYGIITGIRKTFFRIISCNPFTKKDWYDAP